MDDELEPKMRAQEGSDRPEDRGGAVAPGDVAPQRDRRRSSGVVRAGDPEHGYEGGGRAGGSGPSPGQCGACYCFTLKNNGKVRKEFGFNGPLNTPGLADQSDCTALLRAHRRLPHQRRVRRVGRSRRGTTARAPGRARWSRARRTSSPSRRTPSAPDTASPATSARAVAARAFMCRGDDEGRIHCRFRGPRGGPFRAMQYLLLSDLRHAGR